MTNHPRIVYSDRSNSARIYADLLSEMLGVTCTRFKNPKDDINAGESIVYIGRIGAGAHAELKHLRRHTHVSAAILLVATDEPTFSAKPVDGNTSSDTEERKHKHRSEKNSKGGKKDQKNKQFIIYVPKRFELMKHSDCEMYMQHVRYLHGLIKKARRAKHTKNTKTRRSTIKATLAVKAQLRKLNSARSYPTPEDLRPFLEWNEIKYKKTVYLIRGPLGIPLSKIAMQMLPLLGRAIYVDGDGLLCASPDIDQNYADELLQSNTVVLLNRYLKSDKYDYIVYTLSTHDSGKIKSIKNAISADDVQVITRTLTASVETVKKNICNSPLYGVYGKACLDETVKHLNLGHFNEQQPLDVSKMGIQTAAHFIVGDNRHTRRDGFLLYNISRRVGYRVFRCHPKT